MVTPTPQIKAAIRTENNAITARRTVAVKQKNTPNRKSLSFNFLPIEHFILDQPNCTKKKKAKM
jgi:hypothetical protein